MGREKIYLTSRYFKFLTEVPLFTSIFIHLRNYNQTCHILITRDIKFLIINPFVIYTSLYISKQREKRYFKKMVGNLWDQLYSFNINQGYVLVIKDIRFLIVSLFAINTNLSNLKQIEKKHFEKTVKDL